ncbi:MAG: DUF3037 domain-containing protein [Verrucomicrobiales bacterium]|nr:DUF3037 domain-containing protein [Verrucomicrobiales bacterium]
MKTPYNYTVLRYVHDTTTGEFVNVGVAIYSRESRYASALCRSTFGRLSKIFPGMDGEVFKGLMRHIQSRFEERGDALKTELPLEGLPDSVMQIAHAVLPADDSTLQWAPAGSGLTEDLPRTLESIFNRMVTRYDERPQQERRTDDEVWRGFRRSLESRHVLKYLQSKKISVQDDEVEFQYAWKNGVWHCLEPVSLDLSSADSIRDKAHRLLGQVTSVQQAKDRFKLYLLLGEPQQDGLRSAFEKAVSILSKLPVEHQVVREEHADKFTEQFAREIEAHEAK